MRYGLLRNVLSSDAFIELSEKEFRELDLAKRDFVQAVYIEDKFDQVVENYLELEETLMHAALRFMVLQEGGYNEFQLERNLHNRRLTNLLTACRAYIDHSKHHVSQIFGADSSLRITLDTKFSEQYDQRLGYRVMEALRNYVQHRGVPLHSLTYNSRALDGDAKSTLLHTVTPYIWPSELRDDKKFNRSVLAELETIGNKVDSKELFRQYVGGLSVINDYLREQLEERVAECQRSINFALRRFDVECPDDESVIGLAAVAQEEDGELIEVVPLFSDLLSYRATLIEKNSKLWNIEARYVSSEIQTSDT